MVKSVSPYIFIENCSEAMEFYKDALGGEIKKVQLADNIEQFKGHEGKVLHAELLVGDSVIHFSDLFGTMTHGNLVKITLECESETEIRHVYEALLSGGQAEVELQNTFWGAIHANVTDKHGVGWLLNYQK
ncbi:VOC family protein [Mesobacillus harenae]|uniref:VOC family protein n=1 Tax=Mesobacillus harenae TaxID=2213203 RepID=UPI0018D8E0A7|nr:VOC family protein [Mesobacillus harenae]